MRRIAVTETNGKTSTVEFVRQLLMKPNATFDAGLCSLSSRSVLS